MQTREDPEEIKLALDIYHNVEQEAKGLDLAWAQAYIAYFYYLQLELLIPYEQEEVIQGLKQVIFKYLSSFSETITLYQQTANEHSDDKIKPLLLFRSLISNFTCKAIESFTEKRRQENVKEIEFIKKNSTRRTHYFFDKSASVQRNVTLNTSVDNKLRM